MHDHRVSLKNIKMKQRLILVWVVASVGVLGCGGSDGGGAGGEAGSAGTGGAAGAAGSGGRGAGGVGGGDGGMGGEGGVGGQVEPVFTSASDQINAGLAFQLELCQCQGPGEPVSESACLPIPDPDRFPFLPFSDRQNDCFDAVVLGEEERTLENRYACWIETDLAAADCLAEVNECFESAIADCLATWRDARALCPRPQAQVVAMMAECFRTTSKDGVDAFLDSREAQCDCLTDCTNPDRDPEVVQCMTDTLQTEVGMLGLEGAKALECVTKFWRERAVCFGNETSCEGPATACDDLPPPDPACAISGAILDPCLSL
jgi:hypothetical protein